MTFRLPPFERLLAAGAVLLFAALVAAGVHGFSLGVWDRYVPDTIPSYSRFLVGADRPVRSDEWCVSTPHVLAQCAAPEFFPRVNPRVNGGTDMFLSTPCNPVWDWTVPGQFHNWGYFLFGAERGLAWNWWCRYLGIPLFAYLFFLGWFGRDRVLAATAALAVALGAPAQWWDTTMPYLLLYFFAGLVFLRPVVSPGTRAPAKAFASAGLFVSLASYAFAGYPPFAILLFPAFLVLGWQTLRPEDPPKAVAPPSRPPVLSNPRFWLAAILVALAAEFAYYAAVHSETLRTIAGSAYPGKRIVLGGSFQEFLRHRVLDAVCPFFSWPGFKADPALWNETNVCRAARWFVPGTGLAVLFALRWPASVRLRRSDWLLAAAGLWLSAWSAVHFPRRLALASGLFPFPAHRTEVVAGFYFLLFAFRAFSRSGGPAPDRRRPAALAAAVSVAFLAWGALIPGGTGGFFTTLAGIPFLVAAAVPCAAVTAGLVSGSRWLFCGGYAVLSIAGGVAVHPLSRGISPLKDKELAALVREVDGRDPGRWMANDWTTGNFVLAQGLECIPGTQQYANADLWRIIDPDSSREGEWNRYAHRIVSLTTNEVNDIKADSDVLRFTVNERNLRDLGVRHLVWSGKKLYEPWLRYEGRSRLRFVYTLVPEEETAPQDSNRPFFGGGKQSGGNDGEGTP